MTPFVRPLSVPSLLTWALFFSVSRMIWFRSRYINIYILFVLFGVPHTCHFFGYIVLCLTFESFRPPSTATITFFLVTLFTLIEWKCYKIVFEFLTTKDGCISFTVYVFLRSLASSATSVCCQLLMHFVPSPFKAVWMENSLFEIHFLLSLINQYDPFRDSRGKMIFLFYSHYLLNVWKFERAGHRVLQKPFMYFCSFILIYLLYLRIYIKLILMFLMYTTPLPRHVSCFIQLFFSFCSPFLCRHLIVYSSIGLSYFCLYLFLLNLMISFPFCFELIFEGQTVKVCSIISWKKFSKLFLTKL